MAKRWPSSRRDGVGENMGQSSLEHRLSKHPFASALPPLAVKALASIAQMCGFTTGEYLWKQGAVTDALYLIDSGRIALEILIPHHGPLQIEMIDAGEVIDSAWVAPPERCWLDARAISDVTALVVDGPHLRELCDGQPLLGYEMLKRLAPLQAIGRQKARRRILELSRP
jgi:CRP-like cAMP-binding protein